MIGQAQGLAAGDVIIAPPRMQDSRFAKTVIMLTHRKEGAIFGLCLNKPSNHTVKDLSVELDCELPYSIPLYWGGPVHPQTIWMLHDNQWQIEGTVEINQQWAMTSNTAMFHHIADGDTPRNFIITFGFCGWARGQLESELKGNPPWTLESSWLTWRAPDSHKLLQIDPSELWRVSTEQSGHQAVNNWMA